MANDNDAPRFGRLKELDDYQVADGYPDIRGWDVKTSDGRTIGRVDDLVVDTGEMRTRYVDVVLGEGVGADDDRHTLLPIGAVQLAESNDDVLVNGYTLEQIAAMPRYAGGAITNDYESAVRGHRTDYAHTDYDDQRLYASRRPQRDRSAERGDEQRLTLAEEQLAVGKRQVAAGEVTLQKTVETERVREQVALSHDEVTVERRPLSDATAARDVEIGEDEIRIPVMEERVVTQKVLVPREEIIVRKRRVTEQQTVEGDVRRERVEIEGDRPDRQNR